MYLMTDGELRGMISNTVKYGSKLLKIIEKPFSLQQDLTQFSIWSDTLEMCLSTPECEALNISRKKIPTKQEYCCILTGPH